MDQRDPKVFGRNVRAFRALRGWSIRDLEARSGVSAKTIVKIERGGGCTVRTEQKIALGFAAYVGRLWDVNLLSDKPQRFISREQGRWFFSDIEDAERYYRRLVKPNSDTERLRSDPDEIQDEAERHRLGRAGLASAFVKTMGGGISAGYFQYNVGEIFGRDVTPPDSLKYTYLCICARGGIRFGIRDEVFEMHEEDSIVFQGDSPYWMEPLEPVAPSELPPLVQFICLGILTLPSERESR
ncbi:MAG TPA: helix-turn-helix transcriptional regulator [Fimbriimonadaceae bacterium]|nr:helix-turn-helix transcriptional regulator [Fimbriimonadaceae bacterium]